MRSSTRRLSGSSEMSSGSAMFRRIEFRVHCHATEKEERVLRAFTQVSGVDNPDVRTTEGHYGNRIAVFTAVVKDSEAIDEFWQRVREAKELEEVLRTLDRRVDADCRLYLRFDKQEAYLGRVRLADHDDVIAAKAKVAAYPAKRERALEIVREYFEGGRAHGSHS